MLPVGFEPTMSAGEWPQTYALDLAATGTGTFLTTLLFIFRYTLIIPISFGNIAK